MAKKRIHRALRLRRVRVGRGDGWRVWTGSLGWCCSGCAQEAGVSMARLDCSSLGLWVRFGERCPAEAERYEEEWNVHLAMMK